jgi:hypothetical protein
MSTVDLSLITGYTVQLAALQSQAATATDPTVKAMLNSQITTVTAQLAGEAQHQQSQVDASNSTLNALGLFSTLTSAVGTAAPTILALFK